MPSATPTPNAELITSLNNELQALTTRRNTLKTTLSSSTTPITAAQVDELRNIYSQQLALYQLINELNKTYNTTLAASIELTSYQDDLISKLKIIQENKDSKYNDVIASQQDTLRKSKINRYYNDKYEAMMKLIKIITLMLIPTITLAYLNKKEYIQKDAFHVFAIVIVVIGGIFFIKQLIDIMRRSNMDFAEYNVKNKPTDSANV